VVDKAYVWHAGSDKTLYVMLGKGSIYMELVDDWRGRSLWLKLEKPEVQELVDLLGRWLRGELDEQQAVQA